MRVELGIGVLMMTCLTMAIGSCEKSNKEKANEIEVVDDYTLVADSIRQDSTIAHSEIIAYACESLFDKNFLDGYFKVSKGSILDHIHIDSLNGEVLVQISYHHYGHSALGNGIAVYFLNTDFKPIVQGKIDTYRGPKAKLEIGDFNGDGTEEIKVGVHKNYTSVSYYDYDESIYTFDKENQLQQIFTIMTETRNCTAIMEENWNYATRSYGFISKDKIQVKEMNYLVDCEQFERMGSLVKLRRVATKEYTVDLKK